MSLRIPIEDPPATPPSHVATALARYRVDHADAALSKLSMNDSSPEEESGPRRSFRREREVEVEEEEEELSQGRPSVELKVGCLEPRCQT